MLKWPFGCEQNSYVTNSFMETQKTLHHSDRASNAFREKSVASALLVLRGVFAHPSALLTRHTVFKTSKAQLTATNNKYVFLSSPTHWCLSAMDLLQAAGWALICCHDFPFCDPGCQKQPIVWSYGLPPERKDHEGKDWAKLMMTPQASGFDGLSVKFIHLSLVSQRNWSRKGYSAYGRGEDSN